MTIIKDPDGNAAAVDGDNRLTVFADVQTWSAHRNREKGALSVYFTVTPADANDFFWYFRNDGTADIFIHKIRLSSSVITEITFEHVTGTPVFVTGSTPSVVNKNLGSTSTLNATNTFDTDITGLTSQGIIYFEEADEINRRYTIESESNIIIPQGQAVALKRVGALGIINCQVSMIIDSGIVRGS